MRQSGKAVFSGTRLCSFCACRSSCRAKNPQDRAPRRCSSPPPDPSWAGPSRSARPSRQSPQTGLSRRVPVRHNPHFATAQKVTQTSCRFPAFPLFSRRPCCSRPCCSAAVRRLTTLWVFPTVRPQRRPRRPNHRPGGRRRTPGGKNGRFHSRSGRQRGRRRHSDVFHPVGHLSGGGGPWRRRRLPGARQRRPDRGSGFSGPQAQPGRPLFGPWRRARFLRPAEKLWHIALATRCLAG